jgi:hypothetical protein
LFAEKRIVPGIVILELIERIRVVLDNLRWVAVEVWILVGPFKLIRTNLVVANIRVKQIFNAQSFLDGFDEEMLD